MFCPQCGTNQSDDLKFCKSCGANLFAVRQAVTAPSPTSETGGKPTGESAQKFDWSKTWVAEMMLSESEREKRREEIERQRGIAPGETRSQKEIKGGVITASVGLGLMIFLYVFFQGLIMGGNIGSNVVPILERLWIVGVIPLFIGIGLLINGLFVKGTAQTPTSNFEKDNQPLSLPPGQTSQFNNAPSSVTEHTTRELRDSDLK